MSQKNCFFFPMNGGFHYEVDLSKHKIISDDDDMNRIIEEKRIEMESFYPDLKELMILSKKGKGFFVFTEGACPPNIRKFLMEASPTYAGDSMLRNFFSPISPRFRRVARCL